MRWIAAAVVLCFANPAYGAGAYTIVSLGPVRAIGINDSGEALTSTGIYGNGQVTPFPDGFTPGAINNAGDVAGYTGGAAYSFNLAIFSKGALMVNPAIADVAPTAFNSAGQIAGVEPKTYQAFFYSNGALTLISAPQQQGEVVPRAINATGAVAGVNVPIGPGGSQSFEFVKGAYIQIQTPGAFSLANAVNDSGMIAGVYGPSATSGVTTGVYTWDSTGFHALGAAGGQTLESDNPTAINNAGVIVGSAEVPTGGFAWAYFPGTGFINLNSLIPVSSGWQLQIATGINNSGQIVGMGLYNGQYQAFLMTPPKAQAPKDVDCRPSPPDFRAGRDRTAVGYNCR
jgi:probable HAF family extracellular repeat protein